MLGLDDPYNEDSGSLSVYIADSLGGKGVFAKIEFFKGDHLFRFNGPLITLQQSIELGEDECYSVQVGPEAYLQPISPGKYVNHSCEPNCGLNAGLELFALRDISVGEELFFDYSTTMLERRWEMDCKCGKPACRRRIRDFDTLPVELQARYISMEIVQPFIVEYTSHHQLHD